MVLVLITALASASAADVYVGQAKVSYQNLDYEKCLKRLAKAQPLANTATESADVALYTGLCSSGLNRTEEAKVAFALAAKLNPAVELPAGVSPKVRAIFQSAVPQPELPTVVTPTVPPPSKVLIEPREPTAVIPSPTAPPAAAAVTITPAPQRKLPVLGFIASGLSLAALGIGIGFGVSAQNRVGLAKTATFDTEMRAFSDQALAQAGVANAMYITAGLAAVLALVGFLVL